MGRGKGTGPVRCPHIGVGLGGEAWGWTIPTFGDLVVGPWNGEAYAAALSVAEAPARSSNPLFVYGGLGLGKTHLLYAIASHVRRIHPALHVQYVTCETFLNELVDAVRSNGFLAVKRRHHGDGVLLVDDVQIMERKEGLQMESFNILKSLYGAGCQIVLASSRSPADTAMLNDLLDGLPSYHVVSIAPLDADAKVAVIQRELGRVGITLGDRYVTELVPSLPADPRGIIAAVRELAFWSQLWHEPIGASLVQWVVRRRADLAA